MRSGDGSPEGGLLRAQLHSLPSNGLPTSGHSHQACGMWPVPGSYSLSSRCLPTSGHVKQRQRRHGSHRGSICCQVWPENLRRPDAGLVGDGTGGLCLACQVTACLIPGLSNCGLAGVASASTSMRRRLRQRRRGPVATRAPAASGAASIRYRWCRRYGLRASRLCGCVAVVRAGRDAPVPAVLRPRPVAAGRRMTGKQSGTS